MLVLVGERNQVLVTKHVYPLSARRENSASAGAPRRVTLEALVRQAKLDASGRVRVPAE
jgi:hypothetical protein